MYLHPVKTQLIRRHEGSGKINRAIDWNSYFTTIPITSHGSFREKNFSNSASTKLMLLLLCPCPNSHTNHNAVESDEVTGQ